MKGSNRNTDKTKGSTNNRAIKCSLCASFLSLIFSFAIFYFLFFVQIFSLAFALLIFFLSKEHMTINPKKIELNWIKDVAYKKSGLCSKKYIKTCALGNSIFLIEFHKSNFYEPSYARIKWI
jgi:hypothetical protein